MSKNVRQQIVLVHFWTSVFLSAVFCYNSMVLGTTHSCPLISDQPHPPSPININTFSALRTAYKIKGYFTSVLHTSEAVMDAGKWPVLFIWLSAVCPDSEVSKVFRYNTLQMRAQPAQCTTAAAFLSHQFSLSPPSRHHKNVLPKFVLDFFALRYGGNQIHCAREVVWCYGLLKMEGQWVVFRNIKGVLVWLFGWSSLPLLVDVITTPHGYICRWSELYIDFSRCYKTHLERLKDCVFFKWLFSEINQPILHSYRVVIVTRWELRVHFLASVKWSAPLFLM